MCVDPFERIWANILCKLTILFDLPALGNSTGRGEMSPKHQHWNSFSGKALEWIFCAKSWAPLHPWCPGTDLSVTECNMRSLCADSWQLCSRFPLKIDKFVPHSQMTPQLLEGPQLSQPLCCTCVVCSPRRGQAGSTNDYCKQQNYLPAVSSIFSRGFILTPPQSLAWPCLCRMGTRAGRQDAFQLLIFIFSLIFRTCNKQQKALCVRLISVECFSLDFFPLWAVFVRL